MIKIIELNSSAFTRIDNQMGTDNFVMMNIGNVTIQLTSDGSQPVADARGIEIEPNEYYVIDVTKQIYARTKGQKAKAYLDDVLVTNQTISIDTSALAKETTLAGIATDLSAVKSNVASIDTGVGATNTALGTLNSTATATATDVGTIKNDIASIKSDVANLDPSLTWTTVTAINANITEIAKIMFAEKNGILYLKGSFSCNADKNSIGATPVPFFITQAVTSDCTYFQETSGRNFTLKTNGEVTDANFLEFFEKDDIIYLEDIKFYLD